jgi:hypothetical protein
MSSLAHPTQTLKTKQKGYWAKPTEKQMPPLRGSRYCAKQKEKKGVKDDQEKLQRKTVFASSLNSTIQE